ncbi:hypothetical protein NST04_10920 [Paenibacillus sp. FSL H7-0756]|uniref:hypothetical protein n=1 Tax=Paenibacillus sp. FSL H7-0756 TaxID=2954738 RepID=UPI0030FC4964
MRASWKCWGAGVSVMESSLPVVWKMDESELEVLGRAGLSGLESSLRMDVG